MKFILLVCPVTAFSFVNFALVEDRGLDVVPMIFLSLSRQDRLGDCTSSWTVVFRFVQNRYRTVRGSMFGSNISLKIHWLLQVHRRRLGGSLFILRTELVRYDSYRVWYLLVVASVLVYRMGVGTLHLFAWTHVCTYAFRVMALFTQCPRWLHPIRQLRY